MLLGSSNPFVDLFDLPLWLCDIFSVILMVCNLKEALIKIFVVVFTQWSWNFFFRASKSSAHLESSPSKFWKNIEYEAFTKLPTIPMQWPSSVMFASASFVSEFTVNSCSASAVLDAFSMCCFAAFISSLKELVMSFKNFWIRFACYLKKYLYICLFVCLFVCYYCY